MAESTVNYVIKKLESFIAAEVKLQRGLKREMQSLQNELASINTVLKDADSKADDERSDIKVWLRQVREMAYQIEDAMDGYLVLKLELKMGNVMLKAVRWILELKPRHQLATTIKDIKAELADIQRRKESYKLVSTTSGEEQNQRCQDYRGYYSTYVEDSELMGIDNPKSDIIRMLNTEHQSPRRFVIAVVGMGGVGKTTLVQKLYEDREVRKHFHLYAWFSVSRSYNKMDVLRSILKQLLEASVGSDAAAHEVDGLPDRQITCELRDFLQKQHNQRYLVVLDDIWDRQLIDSIRGAFPSDVDGRILMTTRNRDVAVTWTTSLSGHVLELLPLPPNEAWDLFCIKTFRNRDCPLELECLSRQIVEKCEGLPLAIVAIGGFLSTKQASYPNWTKLLNSLGSELTSNSELTSVKRILLLSYHELHYNLKPCFLYFGLFPEDYSIAHLRLIRIWIAEGLVEPQTGKTIEEVGKEYLTELIQRNLVQVASAEATGKYIRVRVHDILREIIISELEETGFGKLVLNDNLSTRSQYRRLSINTSNFVNSNILEMIGNKSKIRCLVLMGDDTKQEVPKPLTISSLVKASPLLKVVDLQYAPINDFPKEVGNLRLLCFLSLRNTKVKTLPKSIGGLVNLETLDLRYSLVRELPKEMSRLCKLRHLRAYGWELYERGDFIRAVGVKIPTGVLKNLKELQKLELIEMGEETTVEDEAMVIKELRTLKQLKKLGIYFRNENGMELCSLVQGMKHLDSLYAVSASEDESAYDITTPPPSLRHISSTRGLIFHKLPGWVTQLVNLVSLVLRHSRLQHDPLPILQRLPNLVALGLYEYAYEGEQLDFGISGFQKLQILRLVELKALKRIIGSPPPLLQGYILKCSMLEEVPPQLQHLVMIPSQLAFEL